MIKLSKYNAISNIELNTIEQKLGITFPQDFTEFVKLYDGAEPEDNILSSDNEISIERFIEVSESVEMKSNIDGLPAKAFPVASAFSGDYIYLDLDNFNIYYWCHESDEECKKLTNTFAEFLSLLEPFDISSINLKPEQVKSVWVDPDFKPEF